MGSPNGYGIRSERYRYTEWRKDEHKADFSMLYDLDTDPHEFNNLKDNPDYSEIKKELSEKLDSVILKRD